MCCLVFVTLVDSQNQLHRCIEVKLTLGRIDLHRTRVKSRISLHRIPLDRGFFFHKFYCIQFCRGDLEGCVIAPKVSEDRGPRGDNLEDLN